VDELPTNPSMILAHRFLFERTSARASTTKPKLKQGEDSPHLFVIQLTTKTMTQLHLPRRTLCLLICAAMTEGFAPLSFSMQSSTAMGVVSGTDYDVVKVDLADGRDYPIYIGAGYSDEEGRELCSLRSGLYSRSNRRLTKTNPSLCFI